MIIFIDRQNCINLHKKLIDQYDKYKSYMLMQTIVDNVNHIHFNFDDSEKKTILSEISDKREDLGRFALWGNVEGVGNTTISYKNSRIDNTNKFTGIHPPLSLPDRFDTNFPFINKHKEYLSSAFMLDVDVDVKDDKIKKYKRKVMICGRGEEMELMNSIYKLATSGNFNLIGKPLSFSDKEINQSHQKLFPEDIPFTYIIVDDPYFFNAQNYNTKFIQSFYDSINSIVSTWKKNNLVDSDHKVQIFIYYDDAKNRPKKITKNYNNIDVIIKSKEGHDRWIYTNYYALASGYGFVSAGGTTYMRFPRMGSNADVINNLIGNRTPDTTDKENEVNTDDVNEFYDIINAFLNSEHCKEIRRIIDGISMGTSFSKNVKRYFERENPKYKQPIQENDVRWDLADYVLKHQEYFNQFRENLNSRAKVFEYLKGNKDNKDKEKIIDEQTYNTINQLLISTQSCLAVFAYRITLILPVIQEKLKEKLGNARIR